MSDVILVNRTKRPRRMLVLNLPKQIAAVKVTNRTTEESRDGARRKRVSTKLVGGSLRIMAGGESEPLDPKVLRAPDVKAAIAARHVTVKKAPTKAEAAETAEKLKAQKARSAAWAKKKAAAKTAAPVESSGSPKTRKKKNGNGGGA